MDGFMGSMFSRYQAFAVFTTSLRWADQKPRLFVDLSLLATPPPSAVCHSYRLGRRQRVFLSPSSPRSVSTSTSLTSPPHHLRLFTQPQQKTTLKCNNFLSPPHSCQFLLLHVLPCDAFLNSSPLFVSCVPASYLKIALTETPKKLVPFSCFLNCPPPIPPPCALLLSLRSFTLNVSRACDAYPELHSIPQR